MHNIACLFPFALFRRWLDVRAAEAAKRITVEAIWEDGRRFERELAARGMTT